MRDVLDRLNAALQGRYRLDGELARGGMGTVFSGQDLRHSRKVAIKLLNPELAHSVDGERFVREIQITAGLSHPHILPLYDSGQVDELFFYVLPLVEGESLRQRLNAGPLAMDEALRLTREVAGALQYAHERGFVHRDIKPDNILLSAGHALVADFGIARAISPSDQPGLTETGVAIGTPQYMSPEQRHGGEVGPASDVYALACVLHEMLAGRPPVAGTMAAEIPRAIQPVLRKALALEPGERYVSGAAFAEGLLLDRGRPVVWERASRLRRSTVIARSAVVIAALVVLGWMATRDATVPEDPRRSILVLPFTVTADKPGLDWLREGSAHMLTLGLASWRDIRVVDRRWLSTLARNRNVQLDQSLGLDQALQLARDAHAGTLVVGEVLGQLDSVDVSVRVYDARSSVELQPLERASAPAASDLRPVFERMANRLLNLSGGQTQRADILAATTNSLSAYRSLLKGLDHLYGWNLRPATTEFRAAIQADSGFALAYHYLSIALGWQDQEDSAREMSHAAVRHSARLPWRPRQHILAHRAFTDREFRQARALYRELLIADSTDGEAWLGLGETEYHDESLSKRANGWYTPSADWNTGIRAFTKAVALDPTFHLGYGHLFDIYNALTSRNSRAFFAPPDVPAAQKAYESRAMFFNADTTTTISSLSFWLGWSDSVVWIPQHPRTDTVPPRVPRATLRQLAHSVADQWAAAAPREARPHEILRDWYVEERTHVGDSVFKGLRAIDGALAEQRLVLERRTDTARADLDRLAMFFLASGAYDSAAAAAERGWQLAQRKGQGQGTLATAVYLAGGRFRVALKRRASWGGGSINYALGPEEAITIKGPMIGVQERLASAVAVGGDSQTVRQLWDSVLRLRRDPRSFNLVSPRSLGDILEQRRAIGVTPIMLSSPTTWRAWLAPEPTDSLPLLDRTYLRAHSDSVALANAEFGELLRQLAASTSSLEYRVRDRFVAAIAAQRLGRDRDAVRLFASLDTLMSQASLDGGIEWAYLSRSYLLRAQSFEHLQDGAEAAANYRRFLQIWKDADPALQRYNVEAREGLRRLGGRN